MACRMHGRVHTPTLFVVRMVESRQIAERMRVKGNAAFKDRRL